MSIIQGHAKGGLAPFYPKTINGSLRFNDDDSAYLQLEPTGSTGGRTKYTYSTWVKRCNIGTESVLFSCESQNNVLGSYISINSSDKIELYHRTYAASGQGALNSYYTYSPVLRDPSAWYHIVVSMDSSRTDVTDIIRLYINGTLITAKDSIDNPTTGLSQYFGSEHTHYIGRKYTGVGTLDAYLAEMHFTDGTAYDADYFGETKNGVWVAKSPSVTYGTNGFYLDFADSAAIGDDESGEGNDWTPNNFTASDVVLDSPTDNFATMNAISGYGGTLSDGNLAIAMDAGSTRHSNFGMSSGQWYWEVTINSSNWRIGVTNGDNFSERLLGSNTVLFEFGRGSTSTTGGAESDANSTKSYDNHTPNITSGVYGFALDADAKTCNVYFNGTLAYTFDTFTIDGPYFFGIDRYNSTPTTSHTVNFGQLGFTYTPPTGYLALSTSNLPDPLIDPAQDDQPRDYFETFLYTGNGTGLQVGDFIKKPADTTTISNSLIFDDGSSTYLSGGVPGTASSTYTLSMWFKRGTVTSGSYQYLFYTHSNGGLSIGSTAGQVDEMYVYNQGGGDVQYLGSGRKIKDTSKWYHVVMKVSSNSATVYLDGVQLGTATAGTVTSAARIGSYNASNYFDGYLAEIHFVDGTAHEPTDFGNFDANGIWIPKAVTGITYGTNGFYLDFSDNTSTTTLGEDQTANGNDWTLNGFTDTSNQVADSPTDNHVTLDNSQPITGTVALTEGNLTQTISGSTTSAYPSTYTMKSGKWFWEVTVVSTTNWASSTGILRGNLSSSGIIFSTNPSGFYMTPDGRYRLDGTIYNFAAAEAILDGTTGTHVFGFALDVDAQTINVFVDGTDCGSVDLPYSADGWRTHNIHSSAGGSSAISHNFGQRDFTYSSNQPAGYLTLSENNITVDDQNLESPNWVWIKNRDQADDHKLFTTLRGVQKSLEPNEATDEADEPNTLVDFNKNGFTIGDDVTVNTSGEDYVAWCWANISESWSNDASATGIGDYDSSGIRSGKTGVSIFTYAGKGTGSTSIRNKFAHGLVDENGTAVIPELFWFKGLDTGTTYGAWQVQGNAFDDVGSGGGDILKLNTSAARTSNAASANTQWTNQWVELDYSRTANLNGTDNICFAFRSVEGFSKFGSYEGNNSTDNAFVYTGFRPAWIMIKNIDAVGNWGIWDTKRNTYNLASEIQRADTPDAKATTSPNNDIDILSNGFKVRGDTGLSGDAVTYIYMAFAENPFKYSNAR